MGRWVWSVVLLSVGAFGCGGKDAGDSAGACEGGEPFTGDETCDDGDPAACALTCVCEGGELDGSGCFSGGCMDVETTCSTGCPNFDLGEWTGEYCNRRPL